MRREEEWEEVGEYIVGGDIAFCFWGLWEEIREV